MGLLFWRIGSRVQGICIVLHFQFCSDFQADTRISLLVFRKYLHRFDLCGRVSGIIRILVLAWEMLPLQVTKRPQTLATWPTLSSIPRVTTRTVPAGGTESCIAFPDIAHQIRSLLKRGPSDGAIFLGKLPRFGEAGGW